MKENNSIEAIDKTNNQSELKIIFTQRLIKENHAVKN